MKYTAIYNTATIKAKEYSFYAENDEKAKEFAMNKFNVKNLIIINHSKENRYIRIGNHRATNTIEMEYNKRHNIIINMYNF